MANRDSSMMLTAVRRLCGHVSTDPRGVADQSKARIDAPIVPPPDKQSRALLSAEGSPIEVMSGGWVIGNLGVGS
jgi:hypothetical protein